MLVKNYGCVSFISQKTTLKMKIAQIFCTVMNILLPRAYDLFGQQWDRQALVSAITGCRACLIR